MRNQTPSNDRDSASRDHGSWPRLRQLATIARFEYRLAIRNRWALALAGLFAFFGAILVTFGGSSVSPEGAERMIASLTNLSVYLVPLAALAFGYDAIVGRDKEGWLEVVFALPVSRSRVVSGAYLGRGVVLTGATIIGFGLVGLMVLNEYGAAHWGVYATFVAAATGLGLVFLGLAFFVSALSKEKTHALGFCLLIWIWFVFAHDLLALGAVAAFELSDTALSLLVLANPASIFRVLVLEGLGTTSGAGFSAAFATAGLSTPLLAGVLVAWCVGSLAAATLVGRTRRTSASNGPTAQFRRLVAGLVVICSLAVLTGCFGDGDNEETTVAPDPVSLDDGKTCQVCGMIIEEAGRYGPNAQAFFDTDATSHHESGPYFYDSVREMFVDVFGKKRRGIEPVAIYVTDYASIAPDIEHRDDREYIAGSLSPDSFVDATDAVFVVDSGLRGAMGVDLLPFSSRPDAEQFVEKHGGHIVEYDEIDTEFVNSL